MRALTFFLLLIFLSASAFAASPKDGVVVVDRKVVLSDVFYDLPKDADATRFLAPAPKMGDELVLDASSLLRISKALNLGWRPDTWEEEVIVKGASSAISKSAIVEKISSKIKSMGFSGEFEIYLNMAGGIAVPKGSSYDISIDGFSLDKKTMRFSGVLKGDFPSKNISGQAFHLTKVPLPKSAIQSGDIIRHSDLKTVLMKSKDLQNDVMLNIEDIEGMAAQRTLRPDGVIRTSDLKPPKLVERGQSVTMVFAQGGLEIITTGKALEGGARGDVIRVSNSASSRTVDAKVVGINQVSVVGEL